MTTAVEAPIPADGTAADVVITDRDRAVAEIVPIRRQVESFVETVVREGWLSSVIAGNLAQS